ncbi:MAG: class I SAM-dependent methyltransferase [Mycobacteriales bacterium]
MARLYDDSLYEGAARHYLRGRLPYPQRLATALADHVQRDRFGRLLDVGCGPGSLTLLLAPLFAQVVAVDADADMVQVASAEATRRGITNVRWLHAYAEDLDDALRPFDVVTLAQSFHWMDQPVVAANIRRLLGPQGCCVHVGAMTHRGDPDASDLPHPQPPHGEIGALVRRYLGPDRRAGRQTVSDPPPSGEEWVFRAAGFLGPDKIEVPGGDVSIRTADEVVDAVLSLSSSAPHLFASRLGAFVSDLRSLLMSTSPDGLFAEQQQGITLSLWRLPNGR